MVLNTRNKLNKVIKKDRIMKKSVFIKKIYPVILSEVEG